MIGTKVCGKTSLGKQPHDACLTVVDLFSRHMQWVDEHRLKVLPILVLRGENFPAYCHGTLKLCWWWWLYLLPSVTAGRWHLLLNIQLLLCFITNSNVFGKAWLLHKWLLTEAAREWFKIQVTCCMSRKARLVISAKRVLLTVVLERHQFLLQLGWFGLVTCTCLTVTFLVRIQVFIVWWVLINCSMYFLFVFVPDFFVCCTLCHNSYRWMAYSNEWTCNAAALRTFESSHVCNLTMGMDNIYLGNSSAHAAPVDLCLESFWNICCKTTHQDCLVWEPSPFWVGA